MERSQRVDLVRCRHLVLLIMPLLSILRICFSSSGGGGRGGGEKERATDSFIMLSHSVSDPTGVEVLKGKLHTYKTPH